MLKKERGYTYTDICEVTPSKQGREKHDQIMKVDNIAMLGIDENTVDEVIYEAHANA